MAYKAAQLYTLLARHKNFSLDFFKSEIKKLAM